MTTGEIAQLLFEVLTFLCGIAGMYIGSLNNADDKANISINIITSQSTKNVNSVEQNTENNNTNINNNNVSPVIIIPQSSTKENTSIRSRMDKIVLKKDWNLFNNFASESSDDLSLDDFEYISNQLDANYENIVKDMYLILLFSRKNHIADKYIAKNLVGSSDLVNHRCLQYISKHSLDDYKEVICSFILKSESKLDTFIRLNNAFIDLYQTGEKVTELCNWNEVIDKIANDPDFQIKIEDMLRTYTSNKLKYFEGTYLI